MRRVGLGLGVIALAISSGTAAGAIVLRDPVPQTITYDQLKHGDLHVVVCNSGSRPAGRVRVKLVGFELRQDGQPKAPRQLLELRRSPERVAPGRCARLSFGLRANRSLDPGTYAGTLAIGTTAGTQRVALTIDAPAPDVQGRVLAVSSDVPIGFRVVYGVLSHVKRLKGMLPVTTATPGREPDVPSRGTMLGTIVADTHRVSVLVDEGELERRGRTDIWLLPVRSAKIKHVGVYEGKLELAAVGGGEPVRQPIAVTVTDSWGRPALFVLLGALLAFVAHLWERSWRVRYRWWRRLRGIRGDYDTARRDFAFRRVSGPPEADVKEYYDTLAKAIRRSSSWWAFFDRSSPQYEGVVTSLSEARMDIERLRSAASDGLLAGLNELASASQAVMSLVRRECPSDGKPAGVRSANGLLELGDLKVGGAVALADAASAHVAYLRAWKGLFTTALAHETWYRELAGLREVDGDDRCLLLRVGVAVRQTLLDLFHAKDAAALEAAGTEARLVRAREDLGYLRARYEAPLRGVSAGARPSPLVCDDAVDALDQSALAQPRSPVRLESSEPLQAARGLWLLGDLAVFAFAVVLGVLVALVATYFGKTFGSVEDYLGAIVLGATSELALSTVFQRLTTMRDSERDAAALRLPTPAKVTLH